MGSQAIASLALGIMAVLGLVVGGWWALVIPVVAVPLVYLGLDRGWWGSGLGDGWEYAAALALVLAIAATAAGILIGRLARSARS